MKTKQKLELLAPAGNLVKMKTALAYGADAVYLGIPEFSLRVRINDFDFKGVEGAIAYAHSLKKRVYVTINIFAHERHIKLLPAYLKKLSKVRPDGIILSDPGVLELVKKYLPKVDIHLSTQANCTNGAAVKFWYKQGVRRIILGREVTLKEIKEIHKACPKMELEYFVHGAMCMAYSGRCFLSKDMVGRSANLGDCVQPCRWEYEVFIKPHGHSEVLELVEEPHGTYLLNSKDLCLLEHLPKLIKAGITSFKIEGRAKSVYYLANVIGIYRSALNNTKNIPLLVSELNTKVTHRGYTTGFLLEEKAGQNVDNSHNTPDWEFCGQVISSDKNGVLIQVHNTIKAGDEIEIILPFYDIIKFKAEKMVDFKSGQEIEEAHGGGGGQKIYFSNIFKKEILVLSVLRRKVK
ncbi:MAG: U32 family peptidase C-terminal domain-containing protein [Candidatus Falkowbacteria bacterium]